MVKWLKYLVPPPILRRRQWRNIEAALYEREARRRS